MNEKKLSSRMWLRWFFTTAAVLFLVIWPGCNVLIDPFGAFGDPILSWWSYNETMNPRVAKFSYLEEHHEEYDSYILGCSSTSSFPVESFNELYGARFYNYIVYGSDLLDTQQQAAYLLEHYEVKNLVLNVYIGNGQAYSAGTEAIESRMPWQQSGSSPLEHYKTYLFADPQYALEKLKCYASDGYLQAAHDVFNVQTGAYDKSRRDAENIGSLEEYLAKPEYAPFLNYPENPQTLPYTREAMESVAAIVQMCREKNVNLVVAACPVYHEAMDWWPREAVTDFYTQLAQVTDFWDFSYTSVSFEPRYFYDTTHFRNDMGRMMAARIGGDDSIYIPEDFGSLVTKETVDDYMTTYWDAQALPEAEISAQVPILLYHHIVEGVPENGATVSVGAFESQIRSLAEAGYTAVTFGDLDRYVQQGTALPEKPVLITFDDGYTSNYALAYPILARYGMKATIFPIGVSVGKDTYKDTGEAMIPHFTWEQGREMEASGVITLESHGYDLHQVEGRDLPPIRQGVRQLEGETDEAYVQALTADWERMKEGFTENLGRSFTVLAYPYGWYDTIGSVVFHELGITATVTTEEKMNTILKGMPQSLYALGRFNVTENTDLPALLQK